MWLTAMESGGCAGANPSLQASPPFFSCFPAEGVHSKQTWGHQHHPTTGLLGFTGFWSEVLLPLLPAPSVLTVEPGLRCDAAAHAEAILPVADIEGRHGRMVGHLYERGDSGDGSRNSSPRNSTPLGPRRKCGARGTFLTVPGQSLNPSIWEPVQISESSKDAPCWEVRLLPSSSRRSCLSVCHSIMPVLLGESPGTVTSMQPLLWQGIGH